GRPQWKSLDSGGAFRLDAQRDLLERLCLEADAALADPPGDSAVGGLERGHDPELDCVGQFELEEVNMRFDAEAFSTRRRYEIEGETEVRKKGDPVSELDDVDVPLDVELQFQLIAGEGLLGRRRRFLEVNVAFQSATDFDLEGVLLLGLGCRFHLCGRDLGVGFGDL